VRYFCSPYHQDKVYRLQPGFKNVFDCRRLFRDRLQPDLRKVDMPTTLI